MDPLSAVANIAAVIGLLDSVCRVGKETYKLITAIKHAPVEIANLKVELKEIEFLLVNLSRYCEKYQRQHPSMVYESQSAVGRICMTLRSLQIEYSAIKEMIAEFGLPQTSTRGKLKSMKGKVRLVIGGKFKASFKSLEKFKAQLSSSLQILAGFNDLAVHDQIGSLTHAFRSLGYDTKSVADETFLSERGSLPGIDGKTSPYSMASSLTESPDYDAAVLHDLNDRSSDGWTGGEHLQSAVLPLMLLKPKILEALHLSTSQNAGQASLSSHDKCWIAGELESLLAKCHESAAFSLRQQADDPILRTRSKRSMKERKATATQSIKRQRVSSTTGEEVHSTSFLLQESPTGRVSVRVQYTQNIQSGDTAVSNILILLAPNLTIHREGVFISLSRLNNILMQPSIQRSISTYAVVESNSPVFDCVRSNDIHQLRLLLKNREATPSVRNTENESLLSFAARMLRFDICELLLNEGADPNHCRSDGANAIYDVRNAFWFRPTTYKIPKALLNQILRLFIRAGCDINFVALGGSPLHFTVNHSLPGSEIIDEAEIATLVNLIICLGGDIEHQNADGLTPLLYNACISGWHGVKVLTELLQWGANPHAKTLLGEGALHLAIAFSLPGSLHGDFEFNSLQERLILLLQAGCNPEAEDLNGHTPSDFALSSPRTWFQWCFAVDKIHGLSMVQILSRESPPDLFCSTPNTTEAKESHRESLSPEDSDSDHEPRSGPEDKGSDCTDSQSSVICSHPGHVFISWNGLFPWSTDPSCADCGHLCDVQDIHRRKWQAWNIFLGLRSQLVPKLG